MSSNADIKKSLQDQLGESSFAEFDLTSQEVVIRWISTRKEENEYSPGTVLTIFDASGDRLLNNIDNLVFMFFAKETQDNDMDENAIENGDDQTSEQPTPTESNQLAPNKTKKKVLNFEEQIDLSYSHKDLRFKNGTGFCFAKRKDCKVPEQSIETKLYLLELHLNKDGNAKPSSNSETGESSTNRLDLLVKILEYVLKHNT